MTRSTIVVLICLLAGCAQVPERQKEAAAPPQPQVAAPAPATSQREAPAPAPAPAPASTAAPSPTPSAPPSVSVGIAQGTETVSGAVTKVDKEAGLLELQTPTGWSQFIISDPERKKELQRVAAGEKVEVKVQVQGGERKVIAVLRRSPPATAPVESK